MCESNAMRNIAKIAALSILALSAFHAYAAFILFRVLATGGTTEWLLFNVVDCCDIPLDYIVDLTTAAAIKLTVVACIGFLLVPGLWFVKSWAWLGTLCWCALIINAHWMMTNGKIEFVQAMHWRFIGYCLIPLALLIVSAPLYWKRRETPSA